MNEHPILTASNLSLADSKRTLFRDITFDLKKGQTLAVMGPSGIGKSMLSKAIAGFLPLDIKVSGSVEFNDIEVSQTPMLQRHSRQRPGVVFQDALQALNPLASVEQQLALALTRNKTSLKSENKKEVTRLLSQLGFKEPVATLKLYPSQLSGGQRQRICIAVALLGNADLIIADEPTSALDPITESEILTLYRNCIRERNIAGMLITHDLSAALACDKLLVIADGTVVAYGSPIEAITQSEHPFCLQLQLLLN